MSQVGSIDFTVAIPTYNGANRLPKVLEKLENQIGTEQISWEIIVIDNNSSDDTAKVVENYQNNWTQPYPIRYCFEVQQGLAYARQRAIAEAKGTFIAFLDDDNLPDPNWIAAAFDFGNQHPKSGAFSGQIHGLFETKPPENFKQIAAFLAIREHGDQAFLFDPDNLRLPPGAGLVIRKQAWIESVPLEPTVVGNMGTALARGDDYAPLLYMHKAGWEIWYNPAMHIDHEIPHWRLEREYLLSLARACGLATCQLRMINAKTEEKPGIMVKTILGNLRRMINHRLKYGKTLTSNLIPSFEMEFYWGSLLSPFYYIKNTNLGKKLEVKKS